MKKIVSMLVILLCVTFSAFAQFDFPPPPEQGDPEEIIYCRGTVEINENGNPVPDDPNCVPDPSTGGTGGGIEELFAKWFYEGLSTGF